MVLDPAGRRSMSVYACMCGHTNALGELAPPACLSCPLCGSTLAGDNQWHRQRKPHDLVTRTNPITGGPYMACQAVGCNHREGAKIA